MEELTKRRALEICRDLWDWLADHPEADKEEWPGWKEVGEMEADCPCCEYAVIGCGDDECEHCPLLDYWPKGDDRESRPCLRRYSPYIRWEEAESSHRRAMFARRIANYARKALKSLEE